MMRKTFHHFLAIALLFVSLQAQSSLLYKISGNELTEPSYLFGTMHIICQREFKMEEHVTRAFAETEQLVMELDLSDGEVTQQLQQSMFQPGGPYFDKHLSTAQQETLGAYLQETIGLSLPQVDGMRPFMLSSMLMVQQLDCAQTASYEMFFIGAAQEQKKEIVGLETVAFQIGIFDQIPLKKQAQWLADMAEDQTTTKAEIEDLKTAYLDEDIDGLYTMVSEQPEFVEYTELLLDDRNQQWLNELPPLMRENSIFVAVGAGHLGGDQGVIKLLRAAGYTVTAVTK